MFHQLPPATNAMSIIGKGLVMLAYGASVAVGLVEDLGAVAPSDLERSETNGAKTDDKFPRLKAYPCPGRSSAS